MRKPPVERQTDRLARIKINEKHTIESERELSFPPFWQGDSACVGFCMAKIRDSISVWWNGSCDNFICVGHYTVEQVFTNKV